MTCISSAFLFPLARRVIHLTILLALWFSIGLSIVDHHAVERDPSHSHVVLGGNVATFAQILVFHRHGYERPHHDGPVQLPRPTPPNERSSFAPVDRHADEAQVIAIQSFDGAGVSLVDVFGKTVLTSDWLLLALLPPLIFRGRIGQFLLALRGIVLPVPKPPPRRSFSPSPVGLR